LKKEKWGYTTLMNIANVSFDSHPRFADHLVGHASIVEHL